MGRDTSHSGAECNVFVDDTAMVILSRIKVEWSGLLGVSSQHSVTLRPASASYPKADTSALGDCETLLRGHDRAIPRHLDFEIRNEVMSERMLGIMQDRLTIEESPKALA